MWGLRKAGGIGGAADISGGWSRQRAVGSSGARISKHDGGSEIDEFNDIALCHDAVIEL